MEAGRDNCGVLVDELVQLNALAGKCANASTLSLSGDTLVECLDTIQQAIQAVAAVEVHLIREIDGRRLPVAQHASSTVTWLRERYRIGVHSAKRKVDLARALERRPMLDQAVR